MASGHVQINQAEIEALAHDPAGPIGQILEQFAIATESIAKTLMMVPGSGRYYGPGEYFLTRTKADGSRKVYHWVRTTGHRASAPGEPASSDSGVEKSTIHHWLGESSTGLWARVGIGAYYGIFTELGTRYMEPRPVLRPALSGAMNLGKA